MILACIGMQDCVASALFRPLLMKDETDKNEARSVKDMNQVSIKPLERAMSLVGFSLLKNVNFLLLCFTIGSLLGILVTANIYSSGIAKELCQMTNPQIATMISIGSCFDIASRILSGIVFDIQMLKQYRVYLFIVLNISS